MNVEKLRRIKEIILAEPRRLNMGDWIAAVRTDHESAPTCGTVGCIAGWAILEETGIRFKDIESDKTKTRYASLGEWDEKEIHARVQLAAKFGTSPSASALGRAILDLTYEQADDLFYTANWPVEFKNQYHEARYFPYAPYARKVQAEATAARIEHLIKTGE
jgi:hypothetical protein